MVKGIKKGKYIAMSDRELARIHVIIYTNTNMCSYFFWGGKTYEKFRKRIEVIKTKNRGWPELRLNQRSYYNLYRKKI